MTRAFQQTVDLFTAVQCSDRKLLWLKRKTQPQCFQGSQIRLSVHFVIGWRLPAIYLTALWHAILTALPCLCLSQSGFQPNEMRVHPEPWIRSETIVTYLYLFAANVTAQGAGSQLLLYLVRGWHSGAGSLDSMQKLWVIAVKSGDVSDRRNVLSPF